MLVSNILIIPCACLRQGNSGGGFSTGFPSRREGPCSELSCKTESWFKLVVRYSVAYFWFRL